MGFVLGVLGLRCVREWMGKGMGMGGRGEDGGLWVFV